MHQRKKIEQTSEEWSFFKKKASTLVDSSTPAGLFSNNRHTKKIASQNKI